MSLSNSRYNKNTNKPKNDITASALNSLKETYHDIYPDTNNQLRAHRVESIFPSEIDKMIKLFAHRDLPEEQFEGKIDFNKPEHLVEINGTLDYSEKRGLRVIKYVGPEESIFFKDVKTNKVCMVQSPSNLNHIDFPGKLEHLIHFHSHPVNNNMLSYTDLIFRKKLFAQLDRWKVNYGVSPIDFHQALYIPLVDKVFWFK